MPEKRRSLARSLGIAGKDTLAFALIALGLDMARSGSWLEGGSFVLLGGILLVVEAYVGA